MRVSVTLHTDEPELDGNQRQHEAEYQGFNRQHIPMMIDEDGNGFCQFINLPFPENTEDVVEIVTHFSIGVCVAPSNQGGNIIICGALEKPIRIGKGYSPKITATVGVRAERLTEMVKDGRIVLNVAPDALRGINLTQ